MTIHTPSTLRGKARKLNRKIKNIEIVLGYMRAGAKLCLTYEKAGPRWILSIGGEVDPETARLIVQRNNVAGVGDALFVDCRAQTYRFIS